MQKPIYTGSSDFKEIIESDSYYVDKTAFLKYYLGRFKVMLITRPRRFGKTLTISTIKYFLTNNIDKDLQRRLFCNTEIFKDTEFCSEYMGKFPVISLSLKGLTKCNFNSLYSDLVELISELALQYKYLLQSDKFNDAEIKKLSALQDPELLLQKESLLSNSLKLLTGFLYQYHGQKPVVLIDEYDVPLATAAHYGFYDKLMNIMRPMLTNVLKDNSYLGRGILTGCLRIVKESIFTGLNNLNVNSVIEHPNYLASAIGFTADETSELLNYYGFGSVREDIRTWYDGYRFDGKEIYCPWEVLNYVDSNLALPDKTCFNKKNSWVNTSSNDVIKEFLGFINVKDTELMQTLMDGKDIEIEVNENLTYRELEQHSSKDFWTLLLFTGYLTVSKQIDSSGDNSKFLVKIPNKEIRDCFKTNIIDFFAKSTQYRAINEVITQYALNGSAQQLNEALKRYLKKYISVMDLGNRLQENYYHGYLNGYFSSQSDLIDNYQSNPETGNGRCDIMFTSMDETVGVIIEVKVCRDVTELKRTAEEGLKQILEKDYAQKFMEKPFIRTVHAYAIAFCKKTCLVQYKELLPGSPQA